MNVLQIVFTIITSKGVDNEEKLDTDKSKIQISSYRSVLQIIEFCLRALRCPKAWEIKKFNVKITCRVRTSFRQRCQYVSIRGNPPETILS